MWAAALSAQSTTRATARREAGGASPTVDRLFTLSDGLPSLRVRRVVTVSPRGAWVLTAAGLARYDGFLFHAVGEREGLPKGSPLDIMRVPGESDGIIVVFSNALWHGSERGFVALAVPDSSVFVSTRPAVVAPDSTFVIRRNRVWMVDGAGAIDVHDRLGLGARAVSRLWSTRRGSLWLLTNGGLLHWSSGKLETRLGRDGAGLGIRLLEEAPDGRSGLFAVTDPRSARGLWEWTAAGARPRRLGEERTEEVSDLAFGLGTVALTHVFGGASVRRARQPFEAVGGPAVGRFTSVDAGPDGALWFGTERGLLVRSPVPAPIWGQRTFGSSRLANRLHEMLRTADGTLWLATADGLQVIAPNGEARWIREVAGVRLNTVTGLAESPVGTVWVSSGGDFQGVLRFDGRTWVHDLGNGVLTGAFGHRLRVDAAGDLWLLGLGRSSPYSYGASSSVGAFRRQGGEWRAFRPGGGGLEGTRVYAMDEGADGALWFATNGGIRRYHDGQWRQWTAADGLEASNVFSLAADPDGGVWFAHASGRRLGRITADGSVSFRSLPASVSDAEVWSLRRGPDGRVWLGADGGIAVLQQGDWVGLGSKDGLPNSSIWPVLPESGAVLIGSGDGLVTLDLGAAELISAPAVSVTVRALARGTLEAHWRVGTARPDIDPAQVETRWRLDGGAWSSWTTERQALLSGLFGGRHEVTVQARGVLGRLGRPSASEVSVKGPIWTSAWFLGPLGLALAALFAALGIRQRARRRADLLVRRIADAYSEIYREAPDGYLIERLPDRRIEQANARAAALFGVPDAAALIGVPLGSLLAVESQEALHDATATLLASGRTVTELRGRRVDGSEYDLEVTSASVRDPDGDVVRSRTLLRDVTERRLAQRDLQLFRLTLDATFEPALWMRADGTIIYVNQAFCRMVSAAAESIVGRRLAGVWPSAAQLHATLWEQLAARHTALFESELPGDGDMMIPVEVAGTLLPGDGAFLAAVFVRDIRARRFEEANRRDQAQQLEGVVRQQAVGSMGRAVAHEFNNILAGIMGFGELLVEELGSASAARAHAIEVTRAAMRGTGLVAEVLACTGGGRAVDRTLMAFSPLVAQAVAREADPERLERLHARCDLALGSEAAVSYSEPDLGRAVRHLVRNALEALPESGGNISVEVADVELDASQAAVYGLAAGTYVRLCVRDDGRGMTPEVLRRASEPFFTTKPQGFGLGLGIVQVVATEIGGAVRIESAPGSGTLCELLLPVVGGAEVAVATDTSAIEPMARAPKRVEPVAGRRILAVDDDPTVLRVTGMLLARLGHVPTTAASGEEALALLAADPGAFDFLLTDMSMPGMSGLDLARAARAQHPDITIIVASGYLDATTRQALEEAEVRVTLPKPFGRLELASALDSSSAVK